ncbi:MAG: heparinase II/III family protein [Verrucomicrobia bacterium]|nr:heparinase II/III family protein [Verrucomicrobiota bacterium]
MFSKRPQWFWATLTVAFVFGGFAAKAAPPERGLHSAEEIAIMRENIARHPWAQAQVKAARKAADKWAAMTDDALREMVTPPEVPRAFRAHEKGCPVHGQEVYRHGGYPWILSLETPWKVKCPVGGELYPSNDFGAFLKSGLKDRSLLTGPYADDGWGWRKTEKGAKYWFIAYYNHWAIWERGVLSALQQLANAYLLTDDARYAHKTAVLLLKIAEYYPRYDHGPQSRYGTEINRSYKGKILNAIWETRTVTQFAQAYDAIHPALVADEGLQRQSGLSARQIAERIETNILRDGAHHVMVTGKVRGNFGMHQETLLSIALALHETTGQPTRDDMVRWVMESRGAGVTLNVSDAIYNLVFRDGVPEESPSYNMGWVSNLTDVARLLKRAGMDLSREPKFRQLYDWPLDMAVLGKLTPPLGDTSDMFAGRVGWSPPLYLQAFRAYRNPRHARIVVDGKGRIVSRDIFERPLDEDIQRAAATITEPLGTRSKLFPGYGFATLQQGGTNGVAATLSFPQYHGHRHADFLDLGLYANGKSLVPDFGYPETASADDPRRAGFFCHTVSHNTILVDGQCQTFASPYRLHAYDTTPVLQRVDVSVPGVYPAKAKAYRRCVALVPMDDTHAYVADFFHVAGGRQHDWLVHGSHAEFRTDDLKLPVAAQGTVAGPDVPCGFFYDDKRLQNLPEGSGYGGYRGSGFQFLTKPQTLKSAPGVYRAEWRWTRDTTPAHFSLWCVGEDESATVCSGKPQNRRSNPDEVKFLIRRRSTEGEGGLESVFASVFEPFADAPRIARVERVKLSPSLADAIALCVKLPGRTDWIVFNASGGTVTTSNGIRVSGEFAWLSLDESGQVRQAYVAHGGSLRFGKLDLAAPAVSLKVVSADWSQHAVTLNSEIPKGVEAGQTVMFGEGRYAYEIRGVDRKTRRIELGDQDCVVARGDAARIEMRDSGSEMRTSATMPHARAGMHLLDETRTQSWRILEMGGGKLTLSRGNAWPQNAKRFLITDYGPDDVVAFSTPTVLK